MVEVVAEPVSSVTSTRAALERLFIGNPDFDRLEAQFAAFCPFEAVGMVGQEIRHARFLSYVLDPQRPHGFGTECLRALLHAASAAQEEPLSGLSSLDVHLMDLEGARVRPEWRNIDVLIELPRAKVVLTIELKIDAGEGRDQLQRYRRLVLEEWPEADWRRLFIYLTKRGEEPSEAHGAGWLALPLTDVVAEFDAVVHRHGGSNQAGQMLKSYVDMLRRRHLPNDELEELATRLWSQHREALEYLMERQPNPGVQFFRSLYDRRSELRDTLQRACGLRIVEDHSNRGYLRFAVEDWDRIDHFNTANGWTPSNRLLLIEIERAAGAVKAKFCLGRGEPAPRERIFAALRTGGALQPGKEQTLSKNWKSLASTPLYRFPKDEGIEFEGAFASVKQQLTGWAKKRVVQFDSALAGLKQAASG